MGWRWAFALTSVGPVVAGLMVVFGLPRESAQRRHEQHVLDFRPVLASREVRPYIFGYAVHCWELFGSRSWLVAFIVFAQGLPVAAGTRVARVVRRHHRRGREPLRAGGEHLRQRARDAPRPRAPDLEGDARLGCAHLRARIRCRSCPSTRSPGSSCSTCASSWATPPRSPPASVTRASERIRGATMAVHSMLGFGAGFVAPLVFGVVLDLAGAKRAHPPGGSRSPPWERERSSWPR